MNLEDRIYMLEKAIRSIERRIVAPEQLLSRAQAARILSVDVKTFDKFVHNGHIEKRILPNGQVRYRLADVKELAN